MDETNRRLPSNSEQTKGLPLERIPQNPEKAMLQNCLTSASWDFRDYKECGSLKHSIRTTSKNHRTTSVLRIQKVIGSDFGRYECVARNQLGESRGSIVLK
ncbi:unnamed protein product, partial [Notodromas monacha]